MTKRKLTDFILSKRVLIIFIFEKETIDASIQIFEIIFIIAVKTCKASLAQSKEREIKSFYIRRIFFNRRMVAVF
jgi:hypothetical protein